jgi:hypothetical protein
MKKIRNLVSGWVSMKETVQDPVAITLFMSEVDAYKMGNALEALKDYVVLVENQQTQALLEKLIEAFPKPPKEETDETEPYVCDCIGLDDLCPVCYYEPCPEHPGRFRWVPSIPAVRSTSPTVQLGKHHRDQAKADKVVRDEVKEHCTEPGASRVFANEVAGKMHGDTCTACGAHISRQRLDVPGYGKFAEKANTWWISKLQK